MLFDVASEKGVEVWIYPTGCSIANLLTPLKHERNPRCPELASAALEDAKTKGKPNDIVFLASLRMKRLADQWATFDLSEVLAQHGSDAAKQDRDAALDEAREYIRRIQRLGFHVLIDAPMPVFRSVGFRCSDWFNKMNPICSSGNSISKRFLEDYRQNTMRALSKLKDEFPEISIWDPFYPLCPGDQCSSWDGDGPLFFDGDHLTGHGDQILYPFFRQSVENAWVGFAAIANPRNH
jgi:SGNH domain (fused to AT3 domains)